MFPHGPCARPGIWHGTVFAERGLGGSIEGAWQLVMEQESQLCGVGRTPPGNMRVQPGTGWTQGVPGPGEAEVACVRYVPHLSGAVIP